MTKSNTSIPGERSTAPVASAATPAEAATGSCHRFEDVAFDEFKGELRVAGQPVAVEPRPVRLLSELLLHVNDVVTKEELFEAIWEGRSTVDHVLANAVSKLRSALGEAGSAHRYRAAHGIPAECPGTTRRYIGAAHHICGGPNGAGA
jgi:DNA-binding response OmpR family regulator